MAAFPFEFDWDPVKAQTNFSKHGLDFERAATGIHSQLPYRTRNTAKSRRDGLRWEKTSQAITRWWSTLLNG
jgi:uncharacterized DUF497 family protein